MPQTDLNTALEKARAMGTILDCARFWAATTPDQLAVETLDYGALGLKPGDRADVRHGTVGQMAEGLKLRIINAEGEDVTEGGDVCTFLEEQGVAKMRWPERLEVVEEMPMTPTKKIIKPVLVADIREKAEN